MRKIKVNEKKFSILLLFFEILLAIALLNVVKSIIFFALISFHALLKNNCKSFWRKKWSRKK